VAVDVDAHDCAIFACGQLLNTADVSTSDVSGLHAKLDRKRGVESHNVSVQDKFRKRFHDGVEDLNKHINSFVEQQQQFSSSLCQSFGKLVHHELSVVPYC